MNDIKLPLSGHRLGIWLLFSALVWPISGVADFNPDYIVETIYVADFDDEATQQDWETSILEGEVDWDFGCPREPGGTLNCDYAYIDSDVAGAGAGRLRARLASPDVSTASAPGFRYFAEYDHMYRALGSQTGSVVVRENDDDDWSPVIVHTTTIGSVPAEGSTSVTEIIEALEGDSFQIGFDFDDNGAWGWYWLVGELRVHALANIPDISLDVSENPVPSGQTLELTITVDNVSNPIDLEDLMLALPLPEQLDLDGSDPFVSDCLGGDIELGEINDVPAILWSDGSVAAESSCQIDVQLQAVSAGSAEFSGVLESPVGDSEPAELVLEILSLLSIGGEVEGLASSALTLDLNGEELLEINANGPFQFSTSLIDGDTYEVIVLEQPDFQSCEVSNGEGTVSGSDVTDVEVVCTTNQYTVGGTVTGLEGDQVVLQNNGEDDQVVATDGTFTFNAQDDGTAYDVTISIQPTNPIQTCTVTNGSGTLDGADVADVEVQCSTEPAVVEFDQDVLEFGLLAAGSQASLVVVLTNTGTGELLIKQITDPDLPFALAGGSCLDIQDPIQPGDGCDLEVTFNAEVIGAGEYESSVGLFSNADSSPEDITVRGAVLETVPVPSLSPLAIVLMALLLAGLAGRRFMQNRC
ncbi:DUF1573 domain-containing protein [Wenzhouxiangella sp. AB-CW3]|uniref:Ig-like domain-containing protein n=1 Tax=Wenzhouxiangella sp. AB-CW3 TaxID=2771012 RepID=UPI00168AAF80|nr:DUF1573 domain-containing protein [Wenzhouxiangella sp. AB-CW3]QOC23257.1 DUF1573 domain-containing protein [Wenzhouxiangella sp. AB-CW3]